MFKYLKDPKTGKDLRVRTTLTDHTRQLRRDLVDYMATGRVTPRYEQRGAEVFDRYTGKAGLYEYVGMLFKGTGLPGGVRPANTRDANLRPWAWSQHGNSLTSSHYATPYNSKTTNFCYKYHGDRHNSGAYALVQADNTDLGVEAFVAVDNLSGTTVANANNFCLSCHDGDGNADDVTLGGKNPPVVSRANWTASGHGKESGAYAVSTNSAANVKCVSCHEVHGSNHASLLPADNTNAPTSHQLPSGFPGKTVGNKAAKDVQLATLSFAEWRERLRDGG